MGPVPVRGQDRTIPVYRPLLPEHLEKGRGLFDSRALVERTLNALDILVAFKARFELGLRHGLNPARFGPLQVDIHDAHRCECVEALLLHRRVIMDDGGRRVFSTSAGALITPVQIRAARRA